MAYTFLDLQNEVKRRGIGNQSGTEYDEQVKMVINTSLFRLARECNWKQLRRKATITTVSSYTTGTGAVTATNGSKNVTVTGATFITDAVKVGRRISISGTSKLFTVATITGETTLTLDQNYDGTSTTTGTYKIYGQDEYNMPVQCGKIAVIWHEGFGYPQPVDYVAEGNFYAGGVSFINENHPLVYRMWGDNNVISQPTSASVCRIASSSSSDTSISVTVFGTVSGYPDQETITTNASDGTTPVSGSKSFTSIERVVKSAASVGRITVDSNSAAVTIAVLPAGDSTGHIQYKKCQFYPMPNAVIPVYVEYYKEPWRLVNDGDFHELGADFDEAVILLATCKMKAGQDQKEADRFFSLYADEIRTLRRTNMDRNLDYIPKLWRAQSGRNSLNGSIANNLSYSQLGGYYGPSGSAG